MTITWPITHDFSAGEAHKSWLKKMTRKLSKEEIKDKFDGEELDLSLCNLAKVPVREMVSNVRVRSKIIRSVEGSRRMHDRS